MSQSKARGKRPGKQTSVTKNNFMIIGDHLNKNKFNIKRFVILSAFANKGEINDHVA